MADAVAKAAPDVSLEYAPGAPVRRRRRVRRRVVAVLVLAAVALAVWRGPPVWKRVWVAYVVNRACDYTAPSGRVVYHEGPSTARPLTVHGPVGDPARPGERQPPATTTTAALAAADPPAFTRLAGVGDPGYFSLFGPRGPGPAPLIFLHERATPEGRPVLIAVRLTGLTYYRIDGGTLACSYTAMLLHPNSRGYRPSGISLIRAWGGVHVPTAAEINADWAPPPPDAAAPAVPGDIRVFFGAPDPTDPCAFVVPHEVNGRRKQWRFRITNWSVDVDEQGEGKAGEGKPGTGEVTLPKP